MNHSAEGIEPMAKQKPNAQFDQLAESGQIVPYLTNKNLAWLGATLQAERLKKDITTEQLAQVVHTATQAALKLGLISLHYVIATIDRFEQGAWDAPLGWVDLYARAVGMQFQPVLAVRTKHTDREHYDRHNA